MIKMQFCLWEVEKKLDVRGMENVWVALVMDAARTVAENLYEDNGFLSAVIKSPLPNKGGVVNQICADYDGDAHIVVRHGQTRIGRSVDPVGNDPA